MIWFNFLKNEGFFDPQSNPDPVQVSNGFEIPYWDSLTYLEKLSVQINEGKELDQIDELLAVIKNVSEHPKDNFKTWYRFIKILVNIPNEKIPVEILNFIPVWLSGNFDTMLQTSEICESLLPKFLNEEPTHEDILKAEIILEHLFHVEKTEQIKSNIYGEGESYYSRLYLYFLAEKFEKNELIYKVVKYCSNDFILNLGRTLKFLLLDYPNGINYSIVDGDKNYDITIFIDRENLLIKTKLESIDEYNTDVIYNWEDKDEISLKKEIITILKTRDIIYNPQNENEDVFERLKFALNTDLTSAFGFDSIRKLDSLHSNSEKLVTVFGIIFRDLLNEKAKLDPHDTIILLEHFSKDKKYNIVFYNRIALYVICENWNVLKPLFWKLLNKNDDIFHFFSRHEYQKELFDLLRTNQHLFTSEEKLIFKEIIERGGDEGTNENEKQKEYWQLNWYSALKDISFFDKKYLELSKTLNITSEHYETLGEVKISSGSVSPLSKEDLMRMTNFEIVDYIKTFQPDKGWKSPSIRGLSDTLKVAVRENPEKFVQEIHLYFKIENIYIYSIIDGLEDAWKQKNTYDLEKTLQYFLFITKNEESHMQEKKNENFSSDYSFDLVLGAISHFLTEGLKNDNHAFDTYLISIVKDIIINVIKRIDVVNDSQIKNRDYVSYLFNSLAGKSLKALLEYSLRRARNLPKGEDNKWEADVQSIFESISDRGFIEVYILQGLYFEQFYFLNKSWIINQAQDHYKLDEDKWLAFMGGVLFGNPPFNEELYGIFHPHYERAIENNEKLLSVRNNGLIRHLATFYFWEFETLSSESLLLKFLKICSDDMVSSLITFVWQQKDYQKSLSELEKFKFQTSVLNLWELLTVKYENSLKNDEQKKLGLLSKWIVFIPELNEKYKELILKSCENIDKGHFTHQFLETLVVLRVKGNPILNAKLIAEIINAMSFKNYIDNINQKHITDLVLFLFEHNQTQIASEFCNKMASEHQQFFLRDIYDSNNKIRK